VANIKYSISCPSQELEMKIATPIKEGVKSFLYKTNYRIAQATNFSRATNYRIFQGTRPAALTEFFRSIKPISTNHDLIRIGGETDGGYLVPDDLGGIEVCFSPGVSRIADFESELASRGIGCFLADYSVDAPPITNKLIHFEKKFLGQTEDAMYTTLESWVERNAPNQREFILQMDIEGGEYPVIIDTSSETLRKFRILVIEFHRMESLYDRYGFDLIDFTFRKLLKDFAVVHIHPNNFARPITFGKYEIPPYMEFTFLRKDRISSRQPAVTFPHPLDRKNVHGNEDFSLPSCWFREN
jgi:hypothetical protein